jgi:hypothetical protein
MGYLWKRGLYLKMSQEQNKPRHDNHYQPPCFDDFP